MIGHNILYTGCGSNFQSSFFALDLQLNLKYNEINIIIKMRIKNALPTLKNKQYHLTLKNKKSLKHRVWLKSHTA